MTSIASGREDGPDLIVGLMAKLESFVCVCSQKFSISSRMGIPSSRALESDLQDVDRCCDDYLQPGSVVALRSGIQKIFARASAVLETQKDEDSCLALILMFSAELDEFHFERSSNWDLTTEFQLLGAKLFLFGWSYPYHTQAQELLTGKARPPTTRSLVLHEAMRVSLRLLHTFNDIPSQKGSPRPSSGSEGPPPQIYQPKVDFFTFHYAIATIYLFLSNFPTSPSSDRDLALNQIRTAHTLLTKCAHNDEKHEWARMAFNVDMIGKWYASGRRLPPEATIRNRMGASLFWTGMQQIAVLKAEKGGRSYLSDLTQPLPDRDRQRSRKPSLVPDEDDNEGVDPAGIAAATSTTEPIPATLGMQEGPVDQTGLWPGWDESIWGWDVSMLETTQFAFDPVDTGAWQSGEARPFG